eukprot:GFUD01017648.1.p1 GENE.GFUD01017648.1~~GFUD01017648.1.p1  ORF type:complete len:555 (-),score=208.42 GFUD01017648.1:251-1915(-)
MSSAIPNLERMYECGDVLANAKGLSYKSHQAEYEEILAGVKGADNCKRLSSQFIARFFSFYPCLAEKSIDAMLDLCEDGNVDIRKQAIKDLPTLCRDQHSKNLPKIVDVLTQLLQSEDQGEITIIQNSIMTLIRRDTKGAIIGIFSQIHTGEEVVRERALRLIHTKLKTSSAELLNKESQAQIIAEIKKVFASGNVTAEEFPRLMAILQFTFLPKSVAGQLEIANMVMKMADLDADAEFDYNSTELTDRLLQCATHVLPYFSNQVKSTAFCEYLVVKVLPHYYQLPDLTGMDTRNQLCKLTADLAVNIGSLKDPLTAAKNVFDRLIDYMPLPPATEDGSLAEVPNLEFTKVECLMYTFHQIARQADTFLTSDQERLKDFRSRLQYLARGVQGYIKKLKEFLATTGTKPAKEGEVEDVKIKQIALRTNENIQAMIRDLFHSPPIYKANVVLSFKPREKNSSSSSMQPKVGDKRKPITFSGKGENSGAGVTTGGKKGRGERQLYMDTVGRKGERGGSKPSVSTYRPGGKSARPSGQYNVPQGKYSSKINSKGGQDW